MISIGEPAQKSIIAQKKFQISQPDIDVPIIGDLLDLLCPDDVTVRFEFTITYYATTQERVTYAVTEYVTRDFENIQTGEIETRVENQHTRFETVIEEGWTVWQVLDLDFEPLPIVIGF